MNFFKTLISKPGGNAFSLLMLRIGSGTLMLLHGIGKLADLLEGKTDFFDQFDPLGIGGYTMLVLSVIAEFGCSILVIVGLGTRLALIPLILTMIMAFFVFHAADPLMEKELPLLYLVCFFSLLITGAGKYSLDYRIFHEKR